jgi:porphobilinogen synthase
VIPRPRRNRASHSIRSLTTETELTPSHLVWPVFVQEGAETESPIAAMPGISRFGIRRLVERAREAFDLGVPAVALFPKIDESLKDPRGSVGTEPNNLLCQAVQALKAALPELAVITDVALDPYSSDGHDGLVLEGRIDNDLTLPILAEMAVVQAQAGADIVAPSDMMDGRIEYIRNALDSAGFTGVGICSYSAKYASAFYGPFRDALDSAPRGGDKKTYQMNPANLREALREARLDSDEGADWLMVKPGLPYLDVIRAVKEVTTLPIAAYHVSGEYSMLRAAAERGMLDYESCLLESLLCLRRAGADIIFTYGAVDAAKAMRG